VLAPDDERLIGAPQPGDVLEGKYAIERVLGAGGMGIVVAARHTTLGQRVAIKMLLPEVVKRPEAVERFLREAKACINLKSEHVARVLDVGTHAGAPFMVMEYLDGEDLQRTIRLGTALPIAAALDYTLQAAEALAEAHSMGIVHRDLKPANLFLTTRADGSALVKVLDFGISKAATGSERGITRTDAIMGSPGYMSPEQIRSAKHVDQRSDVWGMGIVLYELLTAQPPFDGEHLAAVSVKIVLETPQRVDEHRPDVPRGLAAVVERCLAKEPEQRYQNMAELAEALLPFASKEHAPLVERIRRITRASVPYAATISVDGATELASAGTAGGWEQARAPSPNKKMMLAVAAAALALGATLAGVFVLGQRSVGSTDSGVTTEPRRPSAATASAAPAELAAPAPSTSPAVPEATVTPAVSAAAAAPEPSAATPAKRQPAARMPRAPQCTKGQVATSGHCCPAGMVWQRGACDRPLATSLP
jgi:eukaryotic-like serine/threonine-protein kinase